jgi:type IV pilus assembly protein PilM
MAAKQPGVWGIDLGQSALKALRVELIDGTVTATAFDYIEHPKILSQPDADPDQLTRDALTQFLSRNSLQGDLVAISVPGQTGLARFVKLPPVESKKIPDIVKFEARQQIPFPLDEVVWDWQRIGAESGEDFTENEVGLFAMKRDMVNRYLASFKDVMIEVHYVQMAPLALVNYVAYDLLGKGAYGTDTPGEGGGSGEEGCTVGVDVGVDNSNLVVTDGKKVIWQRPIPIGGNHFTRALTKEMKLTFAKAEHLKRNATKAEDPKKIFQAMKPVFSDFVGELQRSLGFFTNTHRGANIVRLVGLGNAFRLPGLQKFVSQSLGMELEKIETFDRLVGDDVKKSPIFADNILSFAVAYGLGLQGLKQSRIQTNLLPQEIRIERLIRAKKPLALAGAAALLFGLGIYAWSSGISYGYANDAKGEADKADKGVIAQKARFDTQFKEQKDKAIEYRNAAADIIRGSEERINWPLFYRLLNDCLPRPDGRNLPSYELWDKSVPSRDYWNHDAIRAREILLERVQQALLNESFDQNHLIQINVTGVYSRFCDVPMANSFFTMAKSSTVNEYEIGVRTDWPTYRNADDWKAAPKKPGWAVEIRGYTYHQKGHYFVAHTLVENLRTRKVVAWPLNSPTPQLTPLETSHVALLKYKDETISGGANPPFRLIDSPLYINNLVATDGGGSGGGGGGGGQMSAAPPPPGSGGGMAAAPPPGGIGGTGSSASAPGTRGAPWTGLGVVPGSANSGGGGGGETKPGEKAAPRKRTEFIIVLYWVEPLLTEPPQYRGESATPPAQ